MTRGAVCRDPAGLSGSPSCSHVFLQRCTATSRRTGTEPRRSTVSRGTRSAANAVCEPDWCLPGLMCGSLFSHQVCHLTRWFADIMWRHHAAQVSFREKCKAHIQRQLEIGESAHCLLIGLASCRFLLFSQTPVAASSLRLFYGKELWVILMVSAIFSRFLN